MVTVVMYLPEHFDRLVAPDHGPVTEARRRAFIAALLAEFATLLDESGTADAILDLNARTLADVVH